MPDSLDTISSATGIPRADMLAIWDGVRANQARLAACPRHTFVELEPDKPYGGKWRCTACGGAVDRHAVIWYRKGQTHGPD